MMTKIPISFVGLGNKVKDQAFTVESRGNSAFFLVPTELLDQVLLIST